MTEPLPTYCRVFVDDSVHDADGFVLTAAIVTSDDLTTAIFQLLRDAGLEPGRDEYKSHALKAGDKRSQELRDRLGDLLSKSDARIAIAVTPRDQRANAGTDMLSLIARLKREGSLADDVYVWLDGGLLTRPVRGWLAANPLHGLSIQSDTDSRTVPELQLADMVAHTAATIIRCELGSITKMVTAGPNSGYDPDQRFPLDFELWARLRYNLAGEPMKVLDLDDIIGSATLHAFGLHVNEGCSPAVRDAAEKRLGTVYLGCIH